MSEPNRGCAEAAPKLSAWIDGELAADASLAIAGHLAGCRACATAAEALLTTSDAVRRLSDPNATVETSPRRLGGVFDRLFSTCRGQLERVARGVLGRRVLRFLATAVAPGDEPPGPTEQELLENSRRILLELDGLDGGDDPTVRRLAAALEPSGTERDQLARLTDALRTIEEPNGEPPPAGPPYRPPGVATEWARRAIAEVVVTATDSAI